MTLVSSVVYNLTIRLWTTKVKPELLVSPFNSPAAERLQSLRKGGRLQRSKSFISQLNKSEKFEGRSTPTPTT